MKSQYSILLYSILRDWLNMDNKPHEISLKKLREQLGAMEASYDVYKNLRKRVLDVAVDEINAVSDIVVTYEPVLVARKAVAVKFKPKIKAFEKLIEAKASEVLAEPQKAVRKPRKSGYEDFDWSVCDELEKQDCIDVAKVVEKWMKKEHPEIKLPRRREAVYDTVKAAYKDILSLDRSPFPDRPVGYLIRSVDKAGIVDRYMPAFYSIEALQE